MEKSDKIKLAVAVVLLLGAIGLAVWYFTRSNTTVPPVENFEPPATPSVPS